MELLTMEMRERERLLLIPETSDGFDVSLKAAAAGMEPVTYVERSEEAGTYRISLRVKALGDIRRMFIFIGRKSMIYLGGMKAGQVLERSAVFHCSEIIPRYHQGAVKQEYITVTLASEEIGELEILELDVKKEEGIPMLYLAGDSTVTDQSCEYPYHPGACYSSWGQNLPLFIRGGYGVDNQAHCGLTTETFREEGHYDIIRSYMRPGDYCLFQFGHNDQKLPYLQAETGYRSNLAAYIREIQELGGNPVLVTPLARNTWKADGTYEDLLEEYAGVVLDLGQKYGVPVIDLHDRSMKELKARGKEHGKCLFHPGDMTHTNEYGSVFFARCIAKGLQEVLPDGRDAIDTAAGLEFVPPLTLWEELSGAANNRKVTAEEKEQFDTMEKSAESLRQVVLRAREQAVREKKEQTGEPGGE